MEIRIRDVPAESRAAAMEFVNEYEADHMAVRKPTLSFFRVVVGCMAVVGCDSRATVQHTASRILQDRGYQDVSVNMSPGVADIWCPEGLSSAAFKAKSNDGSEIKGAVCTKGDKGFVVILE